MGAGGYDEAEARERILAPSPIRFASLGRLYG
jgi:hypothetical protein